MTRWQAKETQGMKLFTLESLSKEAQAVSITDCQAGNPIKPEVMQELLLKLMDDLQILKGSQQEKKETAAQSFIPYWISSMIDDG
ncbi:hypothetical protein Tco_0708411 [Tanacetum coccineum]